MKTADVDTILKCIKDTLCQTLRQNLNPQKMHEMDPDEDIPTGSDVIRSLQPKSELSRPAVEHIIGLMDDLSAAHGYISTAAAHFSSLGKLINPETFHIILCTSIRHMVQLNILERFLELLRETKVDMLRGARLKKVSDELLPKSNTVALTRESDKSLARLLCPVLWLKMSRMFLNRGMQKGVEEMFRVKAKQLSKHLMGG